MTARVLLRRTFGGIARPIGSASPALLVALLPKCPACLGAYLAIFSSVGIDELHPGVLLAVMIGGLVVALALLGRAAARRRRWLAFGVACSGATIMLAGRSLELSRPVVILGAVLVYAGALRIYLGRKPSVCSGATCHST